MTYNGPASALEITPLKHFFKSIIEDTGTDPLSEKTTKLNRLMQKLAVLYLDDENDSYSRIHCLWMIDALK